MEDTKNQPLESNVPTQICLISPLSSSAHPDLPYTQSEEEEGLKRKGEERTMMKI